MLFCFGLKNFLNRRAGEAKVLHDAPADTRGPARGVLF